MRSYKALCSPVVVHLADAPGKSIQTVHFHLILMSDFGVSLFYLIAGTSG